MINLTIPGIPIPWKSHAGYGRRSYNPRFKEKQFAQYYIKEQWEEFAIGIITGAVAVHFLFHMPIPTSTSKKKKVEMLDGTIPHTKRPDCTNMQKFYEDCLKGIVILDDSLVKSVSSDKIYSEEPRTTI